MEDPGTFGSALSEQRTPPSPFADPTSHPNPFSPQAASAYLDDGRSNDTLVGITPPPFQVQDAQDDQIQLTVHEKANVPAAASAGVVAESERSGGSELVHSPPVPTMIESDADGAGLSDAYKSISRVRSAQDDDVLLDRLEFESERAMTTPASIRDATAAQSVISFVPMHVSMKSASPPRPQAQPKQPKKTAMRTAPSVGPTKHVKLDSQVITYEHEKLSEEEIDSRMYLSLSNFEPERSISEDQADSDNISLSYSRPSAGYDTGPSSTSPKVVGHRRNEAANLFDGETEDDEIVWLRPRDARSSSSDNDGCLLKGIDAPHSPDISETALQDKDQMKISLDDASASDELVSSRIRPADFVPHFTSDYVSPECAESSMLAPTTTLRMETVKEESGEGTSGRESACQGEDSLSPHAVTDAGFPRDDSYRPASLFFGGSSNNGSEFSDDFDEAEAVKFAGMMSQRVRRIQKQEADYTEWLGPSRTRTHDASNRLSHDEERPRVDKVRRHRWRQRLGEKLNLHAPLRPESHHLFSRRLLGSRSPKRRGTTTCLNFPDYLDLHQRGWQPVDIRHSLSQPDLVDLDEPFLRPSSLFRPQSRTGSNNSSACPNIVTAPCSSELRKSSLCQSNSFAMRPVRGFEAVWLVDHDDSSPATKDWAKSTPLPELSRVCSSRDNARPPVEIAGTQTSSDTMRHSLGAGPIWSLALSEDQRYLAAGSRKGVIFIWKVKRTAAPTERVLSRHGVFAGHTGGVLSVQWSPISGSYVLISCSFDRSVRVWTLSCDATLTILRCMSWPTGVAFTHPGRDDRVALCSLDGTTKLLRLKPSPSTFETPVSARSEVPPMVACEVTASFETPEAITSMSVSPDGLLLSIGTQFGRLFIHHAGTGALVETLDCRNRKGKHAKGEKVTGIDWGGAASDFICVTAKDGRIRVVPLTEASKTLKLKGTSEPKLKAYLDPSSRFVIAAAEDNHVHIWDLWEAARLRPVVRRQTKRLLDKFTGPPRRQAAAQAHRGIKEETLRDLAQLNDESDSDPIRKTLPKNAKQCARLLRGQVCGLSHEHSCQGSEMAVCPSEHREGCCYESASPFFCAGRGISTEWIPDLPIGVSKRPTAFPIASFRVPEGAITTMLVSSFEQSSSRRIEVVCGTNQGSVYLFAALLSE